MRNEGFRQIPGFPGYSISKDGRVLGKSGKILRPDPKGSVALMRPYPQDKAHTTVALLVAKVWGKAALADYLDQPHKPAPVQGGSAQISSEIRQQPEVSLTAPVSTADRAFEQDQLREAQDQVNALKRQLAQVGRRASYQRKLNATLWSRLRTLEASLATADRRKAQELVMEEKEEWQGMADAFDHLPDDLPDLSEAPF